VPEEPTPQKPGSNLAILLSLLLLLLLAGAGYWGWQAWQQRQASESESSSEPTPAEPAPAEPTTPPATPPPAEISASLRENIEASINTMNTAALEGYMTDPVTVILAASECCGSRTPAQAVADLNYLSGATDPWDWNLSAATLAEYKNGFYGQYFSDMTVVGQSANDYVVSFTINSDNKITTIFYTNSADLLK
jgi:hypothetical protein